MGAASAMTRLASVQSRILLLVIAVLVDFLLGGFAHRAHILSSRVALADASPIIRERSENVVPPPPLAGASESPTKSNTEERGDGD